MVDSNTKKIAAITGLSMVIGLTYFAYSRKQKKLDAAPKKEEPKMEKVAAVEIED